MSCGSGKIKNTGTEFIDNNTNYLLDRYVLLSGESINNTVNKNFCVLYGIQEYLQFVVNLEKRQIGLQQLVDNINSRLKILEAQNYTSCIFIALNLHASLISFSREGSDEYEKEAPSLDSDIGLIDLITNIINDYNGKKGVDFSRYFDAENLLNQIKKSFKQKSIKEKVNYVYDYEFENKLKNMVHRIGEFSVPMNNSLGLCYKPQHANSGHIKQYVLKNNVENLVPCYQWLGVDIFSLN